MRDEHPILDGITRAFIIAPIWIAAAVWCVWATVIGFAGGTLPLTGIDIDGSVLTGFLFLLLIDIPAAVVARFASLLIAMVVMAPLYWLAERREA